MSCFDSSSSSSRGRTRVVEVNIRSPDFSSKVKKSRTEIYAKLWVEGNEERKLKTGNLLTLSPGNAKLIFSYNNIASSVRFNIYRARRWKLLIGDKLLGRAKCDVGVGVATEDISRVRVEKGSVVIGEFGVEMVVKKVSMDKEDIHIHTMGLGLDLDHHPLALQQNKSAFHFAPSCFRKTATKD